MDLNFHTYSIVLVNTRVCIFSPRDCPIEIGKSMTSLVGGFGSCSCFCLSLFLLDAECQNV